MLRRLFLFSLLTCVVGAFSSAEVVWFSNTSCGSQRHLCVPSFLLRSKTADLADLPPAAPPAAGLAALPCALSRYIDIPGELLYLIYFFFKPTDPGGLEAVPPLSRASSPRGGRRGFVLCSAAPRAPVLGAPPPSLSAQPSISLLSLPLPEQTRVAPPLARALVTYRPSFSLVSRLEKVSIAFFPGKVGEPRDRLEVPEDRSSPKGETKFVDDDDIYRRRQKKNNVGFPRPGRSQKQAQNRRMTRPCLSKKSAPLSTGAGFVPAVGP